MVSWEGGSVFCCANQTVGLTVKLEGYEIKSLFHKCSPSLSVPWLSLPNPAHTKHKKHLILSGQSDPFLLLYSPEKHNNLVETLLWVDGSHAAEQKRMSIFINMETHPLLWCIRHTGGGGGGCLSSGWAGIASVDPPHTGVVRRLAVLVWAESFRSFWMQLWTCRKLWSLSEL